MLIQSLGLFNYIDKSYKIPKTPEDKSTDDEVKKWTTYRDEDAKARLVLIYNIESDIQRLVTTKTTALSMWTTLVEYYEGKGYVVKYNAIMDFVNIQYEHHQDLTSFIVAFKSALEKLSELGTQPPDEWHTMLFIAALNSTFPTWAERQRSLARNAKEPPTLAQLIVDISDEAHSKDAGTKTESIALYRNRPEKGKGKGKGKSISKPKCLYCQGSHLDDNCFIKHPEKKREWEEKHGKKWEDRKKKDNSNNTTSPIHVNYLSLYANMPLEVDLNTTSKTPYTTLNIQSFSAI